MKKRKGKQLVSLISLYLNYAFQKSTVIIFSISLVLMVLALVFIANPKFDLELYMINPSTFHESYFTKSIFVLNVFNGILISTIVILLFLLSNSFDSLFLSHIKRSFLITSKILSVITEITFEILSILYDLIRV